MTCIIPPTHTTPHSAQLRHSIRLNLNPYPTSCHAPNPKIPNPNPSSNMPKCKSNPNPALPQFVPRYISTIGVDFGVKPMEIEG